LDKNKISFIETKVGDRYVIEEMSKSNLNLGGEQSGHIIMSDHTTTGDGIITGLQIAKMISMNEKSLSSLSKEIKIYPQELINVRVKEKKEIKRLKAYDHILSAKKRLGNNGRVLVRYSGTENICRVMVEAKTDKLTKNISKKIAKSIYNELGR
jgi:phosphoglucosamine mutase